jgi:hypothetical protein
MFNRKIKTIIALVAAMSFGISTAQAHRVEITRSGEIKVSKIDPTTKVVASKSGGYRRVVVTSLVEKSRPDGSTEVYEATTSAKVRIKKCPKRAKRCVQEQLVHGPDRLIRVVSPPSAQVVQGEVVNTPPADGICHKEASTLCGADMVAYSKPVVNCTFPQAWIIPPSQYAAFISSGVIWCEVQDVEGDPVAQVRAVSTDSQTDPSRFVPSEYRANYNESCPGAIECFRAAYTLDKPGEYHFRVTVTTQSGQQAVVEGSALVKEGYPDYPSGGGKG